MTDISSPALLQDATELLTSQGFKLTGKWYHGTASGLLESILETGLRGTGDISGLQKHMETLGTIGHQASNHHDPLFVTQSKELAYFWALQKADQRNLYFRQNETPVVLELSLPEDLNKKVTTDAGGAALVLEPNNFYIVWLKDLYKQLDIPFPELNPFECDRMDYLNKLGLAYIDAEIPAQYLREVKV